MIYFFKNAFVSSYNILLNHLIIINAKKDRL